MFFFSLIGLGFIVAAWATLLVRVLREEKQINKQFLALYIAGTVLVIIGAKEKGLDISSILNIASAVLATVVFLKLR